MPFAAKFSLIGAVMLICALPAAGSAQTPTPTPATRHAMRCLIMAAELAGSEDATVKQVGMMGGLFYSGEVFGADPQINLAEAMKNEAETLKPGDLDALRHSCGGEMKARGEELKSVGAALKDVQLPETKPPTT